MHWAGAGGGGQPTSSISLIIGFWVEGAGLRILEFATTVSTAKILAARQNMQENQYVFVELLVYAV